MSSPRTAVILVLAAAGCVACASDAAPAPGGNSGGVPASGGVPVAGGSLATGSGTGTGGTPATGGVPATGGAPASGGVPASGGSVGSGGVASGGAGTGGTPTLPDGGAANVRAVASPPTYRGTVNGAGTCSRDYPTRGFEPDDAAGTKHPLFLYFVGTNFVSDEASFREGMRPAAEAVTRAMARRGMVALWVEYDNSGLAWLSDHVAQLGCLFGAGNAQNVLKLACALPQVDCNLGIATWGHSQGGYVANRAHNDEPRVRATWLAGYGGDETSTMPKDRIRIANGENDTTNGQVATVNKVSGLTLAECPDDGRSSCFRPDGSGWVIVRAKDCVTSTADHCWFDKKTCTDSQVILEPNWIDPASTKPFALEPNANWVASTVARR